MEHLVAFIMWLLDAAAFQRGPQQALIAWVLLAYLLWDRFVLIMGLYRAQLNKRLYGLNKILAAPNLVVGILLDIACNIVWATLVFRELPREWLVTTRLQRYIHEGRHSWRRRRAQWWCEHVLDPLDPTGKHC